jgi:hypothetical protein
MVYMGARSKTTDDLEVHGRTAETCESQVPVLGQRLHDDLLNVRRPLQLREAVLEGVEGIHYRFSG